MRLRASLTALVLAAQAVAPVAMAAVRPCCCAHAEKRCHCPGCSQERAIEEGPGALGCAASPAAIAPSPPAPALPPALVSPEALAALPLPALDGFPPPSLPLEVPTPPPLA